MMELMNMIAMFIGYIFFALVGILILFMIITGSIFSVSQYRFLCKVHKKNDLRWSAKKRLRYLMRTAWEFAGRLPCPDTGIKVGFKDGSYWKGIGNWYVKGVAKGPKTEQA